MYVYSHKIQTQQLKISYKKRYMLRIGSVQHSSDFHLANNPLPEQ